MDMKTSSDASQEKPAISADTRGLQYLFDSGISIEYLCETGLIDADLERVEVTMPEY